jgi:hypothetical protein
MLLKPKLFLRSFLLLLQVWTGQKITVRLLNYEVSQKVSFLILYRWTEVSSNKSNTWICLDFISRSWSGIFHNLRWFSKHCRQKDTPCSRNHFWTHSRTPTLSSRTFKFLANQRTSPRPAISIRRHSQSWGQNVSFYRKGLESLIVRYDNCPNNSGDYMERLNINVQTSTCFLLFPLTPIHLKK